MIVRRWGWYTWAAYVDDGSMWGRFVAVGHSPQQVETLATQAMQRDSNAGSWENEWDQRDGSSLVPARHLNSPGSEHHDGTTTTRHLRKR